MPWFTLTYADGTTETFDTDHEPWLTAGGKHVSFNTQTGLVGAVLTDDKPEPPAEEEPEPKKAAKK